MITVAWVELTLSSGRRAAFELKAIAMVAEKLDKSSDVFAQIETAGGSAWDVRENYETIFKLMAAAERAQFEDVEERGERRRAAFVESRRAEPVEHRVEPYGEKRETPVKQGRKVK